MVLYKVWLVIKWRDFRRRFDKGGSNCRVRKVFGIIIFFIFYKPTQHTNMRHKPARGIAPTWHIITVKRRGRIIFIRIGLVSQSDLRIEVVCAMDPIRIGMNRTATVKTSG
jgi:hypothetical protein